MPPRVKVTYLVYLIRKFENLSAIVFCAKCRYASIAQCCCAAIAPKLVHGELTCVRTAEVVSLVLRELGIKAVSLHSQARIHTPAHRHTAKHGQAQHT